VSDALHHWHSVVHAGTDWAQGVAVHCILQPQAELRLCERKTIGIKR
jgi:hypothetical protein